jgi:hypothetical protein
MFLFYFDDTKVYQPTKPLGTQIKAYSGHFTEWQKSKNSQSKGWEFPTYPKQKKSHITMALSLILIIQL